MSPPASKTDGEATTRHVAPQVKALGIDLGGASSATTGYALIDRKRTPRVRSAGCLPVLKSPAESEAALLAMIDEARPDVLAIDAPLTLPPCMSCPSYCRGPDPELCELTAARQMWGRGSNPVSRRLCELEARETIEGLDPKPTMGLGIITARAVALVRRLSNRGVAPASIQRGEILEVYPRATLARLGAREKRLRPKARTEKAETYRRRVVKGLQAGAVGMRIADNERMQVLESGHTFDAVLAAYTGWLLYPDGLERPPEGFNIASGWIWFPAAT